MADAMKFDAERDAFTDIDPFDDFARVTDPGVYRQLPDSWQVGVADVVNSRAAVEAGRYRAVNMAGAATISAIGNGLAGKPFPFVFGGDGVHFAIAPEDIDTARDAMTKTASWVRRDLDLELRVGMTSISELRAAGHDLRVARYAASEHAIYAMFSGGGVEWVERMLKSGRFGLDPAPNDAQPDLTGLSCLWGPVETKNGVVLSMIVKPMERAEPTVFTALIRKVLAALGPDNDLNPVSTDRFKMSWLGDFLAIKTRIPASPDSSALGNFVRLNIMALIAWLLFKIDRKVAGFDPRHYRHWMAENSDYRKFDDGLLMTVDCTEATAAAIERLLEAARSAGIAHFGLHRQQTALMTCIVPSIYDDGHLHFLDGGEGGYTQAARQLERAMSTEAPLAQAPLGQK